MQLYKDKIDLCVFIYWYRKGTHEYLIYNRYS